MNKNSFAFFVSVALCLCLLAGCGTTADAKADDNSAEAAVMVAEPDAPLPDAETEDSDIRKENLSGTIPAELATIPDSYHRPAEHQGTLEKLTYDTWESFTYDQHSQRLTKEAWVYLPFGYSDDQQYNVFYISHGGWSDETTLMGTDQNPTYFKHVMENCTTSLIRIAAA